ncbi:F0F1 ATP synthase subunit A [Desulfallas sp. Bu1-1]|uniref:F0F1 ATP synthase subunit A n=1 Tax=Desulfallas sp. Bu1-1 TaxID=2787620 RepID=UPI001FAD8005|nr:F0F1 ATP synthase subunit A [Desulfallas sp. Bu1-1]
MSAAAGHEASQDMLTTVHHNLNVWGFPETPVDILGFPMNLKTLVMTWIVMALVILFTVSATRNMQLKRPGKLQLMVEEMYQFLRGLAYENLDPKKGAALMCLLFSLFIYLLFCNLWGLIPTMMSPTADVNTTLGMAIGVFITVQILGLYYRKAKYFKHFVEPFVFFLPLVIVEELSKPLTLAFRLYGNIYAGEVLIAVLLGLIPLTITIFGGFIASVVWLAFSIFVGFIQAFIFTMLTIAYISQVTAEHH